MRHTRICCVAFATLAVTLRAPPPSTAAGIQSLVSSGEDSPDGNGKFSVFYFPSINNAGQVAFVSDLTTTIGGSTDNSALYRRDPSGLVLIARKGQSLNNTPITGFFTEQSYLDNSDNVAAVASLVPSTLRSYFIGGGGPNPLVVLPGSSSPSGNNTLLDLTSAAVNDAGVALYAATYSGANFEIGLYERATNGAISTRLLRSTPAPRGGSINNPGTRPTLNESGQIGTILAINMSGSGVSSISRLDGTVIHELVRQGDLLPDNLTTLGLITSPAALINDAGQLAFAARYTQPAASRTGIFLAQDSGTKLIAPGILPGTGVSVENMHLFGISAAGTAAFIALFDSGFERDDPLSGIYLANPSAPPTLVAFEDAATPVGNKFFRGFFPTNAALNNAGQLAFLADLSDTINGPTAGRGIFYYDSAHGLQKIIRVGDTLFGSTVTAVYFGGTVSSQSLVTPDTSISGLSHTGQVAFKFTLANGQNHIATWSAPALLGDFNGDDIVDTADYVTWRYGLGDTFTQDDYSTWRAHFGQTAGSGAISYLAPGESPEANPAAIPEPATSTIIVAALLTFAHRRRHHHA